MTLIFRTPGRSLGEGREIGEENPSLEPRGLASAWLRIVFLLLTPHPTSLDNFSVTSLRTSRPATLGSKA